MRLVSIFCAETVLVDSNTSRVSCINLIDDIASPQFPLLLPQFSVLSLIRKDEGDAEEQTADLSISIGDQKLAGGPVLINFQGLKSTRAIVTIAGFILPQPGTLSVKLTSGETVLGEWSVSVQANEPQQLNIQNEAAAG